MSFALLAERLASSVSGRNEALISEMRSSFVFVLVKVLGDLLDKRQEAGGRLDSLDSVLDARYRIGHDEYGKGTECGTRKTQSRNG